MHHPSRLFIMSSPTYWLNGIQGGSDDGIWLMVWWWQRDLVPLSYWWILSFISGYRRWSMGTVSFLTSVIIFESLAGGSFVQVLTLQSLVSSHSLPEKFFGRGLPCPNWNSSRLENMFSHILLQRRSLAGSSLVQIATCQEHFFQHSLALHFLAGGSR